MIISFWHLATLLVHPGLRPEPITVIRMADSKMDVSPERRLRGKINFIAWRHDFQRAAKAHGVSDIFNGRDDMLSRPKTEDYIDTDDEKDLNTIAATQKSLKGFHASTLRYNIEYNNWRSHKEDLRVANKLLYSWVSESIKIEIETANNPKDAYDLIVSRYKVSDERARDELLSEMRHLTIDDCKDITDYLNKLRRIKSDLKSVGYTLTDGLYVTAVLDGLDNKKWALFKKEWHTIRAIQLEANPDSTPSIDLFEDRLHTEVLFKQQREEDRKKQNSNKDKTRPRTVTGNTTQISSRSAKTEDKTHPPCSACGDSRHTEMKCWKLHPEQIPRALKDRIQSKNSTGNHAQPTKTAISTENSDMAAFADADVEDFNNTLADMDSMGTRSPPSHTRTYANPPPQTRKSINDAVEGLGGGTVTKNASKADQKPVTINSTISTFLAGPVQSSDVWLADTAANMHIVNDPKWFTVFHSFSANINTADRSATLQVQGGGKVEAIMLNSKQQPIKLCLSNVAYAPQGRCNLLSIGLLARKAKAYGRWDDRGMVFSTADKQDVGYATLTTGLFHLHVKPLPNPNNPFQSGEVIAAAIDFDDPVWRMHRRLGHLSFQGMLNLKKSSTGMNITEQQIKEKLKAVCPVCATTRALVRIPRDPANRHSNEIGDLMHVDVWGPYPIEGYDGTTLFLLMTDDHSRFTWSERLRTKGEATEAFRRLHRRIEKVHKVTIRKYRFDNEFAKGPVGSWCTKHHIGIEATVPYAHHMNGVAERNMRTIREKAASMIQETTISGQISKIISEKSDELLRGTKIPANLWPEAFVHAI
jgi:hypothetical protein